MKYVKLILHDDGHILARNEDGFVYLPYSEIPEKMQKKPKQEDLLEIAHKHADEIGFQNAQFNYAGSCSDREYFLARVANRDCAGFVWMTPEEITDGADIVVTMLKILSEYPSKRNQ